MSSPSVSSTSASSASSVGDLRILADMVDEITQYGYVQLPGMLGLRRFLRTKRGQLVGKVLDELSVDFVRGKLAWAAEREKLVEEINGLRNEMQSLTDASLRLIDPSLRISNG